MTSGLDTSLCSPSDQFAARALVRAGFGVLLPDAKAAGESGMDAAHGDVLAQRFLGSTLWLRLRPQTARLPVGYFGIDAGATAALIGAARAGREVGAVVAQGDRADLTGAFLARITAPTLLIAAGANAEGRARCRSSLERMRVSAERVTVPGATRYFEEPGALEGLVGLAVSWFDRYLAAAPSSAQPRGVAGAYA